MKTDTRGKMIIYIRHQSYSRPQDLTKYLGLSRVAVHRQLTRLVREGILEKQGAAPKVRYIIARQPHYLWDYNKRQLQKTKQGRIKILERMINYGPEEGEKIPLDQVKKYWNRLDLYNSRRRLLELLIWGKIRSSPYIRDGFSIK